MMNTIPLHYSIPAYIATNPSTGICNVYDHLPQRLDNGDYAGNIILTLGVKGTGEIPDRINYWSLQGIELPKPGTPPIRFSLELDLSDQGHPITEAVDTTEDTIGIEATLVPHDPFDPAIVALMLDDDD